ncbi:hypothetical protein HYU92_00140 [Candidatus Curtissbacteria bacterium]|nr:hypothetical protein [Candidatus Curtissbacteria bacterium]
MEVFSKLLGLPFWEKLVDLHGLLAMVSLVLFGAGIILYFVVLKSGNFIKWLKTVLLFLFADLVLLDIAGLSVYIPYRAPGGPRSYLISQEETAWLHGIIFEHKEFLAFAPPLIILTAFLVVRVLGKNFNDQSVSYLRRSVIFSLLVSLVFVLVVAAEAVLVTKAAPVG